MDNFRSIQGQDYGILRKKENKDEELFVFGYSCKIYEDYDKSLYVDQGKHLIPWLGDENLKIDRYDCRGALNDLTKYLPKSESFDSRASLSSQEKRIEQLCDEERYKALTTNEEEETLYQEEELKRLQQALNNEKSYSEVGFSYENDNKPEAESAPKDITAEEGEAFIPPYQLDVPVGMKIPKTKKHHEIIERTAFFINDQGPQMEILLKIKQAENPQFNFLSFDNELHPYYRHLLMAVKSEKYKPISALPVEKETNNDETYLHPSLVQASQSVVSSEPAPKIPTIAYKPSADCTYSALVNRIKETQTSSLLESIKKNYGENCTHSSEEKDISAKTDGKVGSTSTLPLSALTKSARRRRIRKEKHKAAAASFKIYYSEEAKNSDEDDDGDEDDLPETDGEKSANSNSENLQNTLPICVLKPVPAPTPVVKLPPLDMQLIIDKMASYVAKNGRDFENVVQNKGDARFSFLNKDHEYNPYYQQKVQLYLQLENPQLTPVSGEKVSTSNAFQKTTDHQNVVKSKLKMIKSSKSKQPTPICFSIKKPKDQETLEIKSALPYEESEGEEGAETEDSVGENLEERSHEMVEKNSNSEMMENSSVDQIKRGNTKKPPDMTLEKWARERLQAKLVTVAKEKLAAKAVREKDKQLQAERRKKAADFINLLQKDNLVNKTQASETIGDFSTSGTKKDVSDVITIPSDSSLSDSDSIVSVPFSEDEAKQKHSKRKSEELENDLFERTKKRLISSVNNKNSYARTKHGDQASDYRRSHSPVHSKHSRRYKKYDREKKSYKKKKHRHSREELSSPSSNKKSYKKKKRTRYSSDNSGSSSSDSSSCSSDYKK